MYEESTISTIYCKVSLLSNVEATLPQRYKSDVVVLTLWRCCDFNAAAKLSIQHPQYCELNLLSNVEATFEQRCNFDVVVSMSLQCCVLVVRHYELTTTLQ